MWYIVDSLEDSSSKTIPNIGQLFTQIYGSRRLLESRKSSCKCCSAVSSILNSFCKPSKWLNLVNSLHNFGLCSLQPSRPPIQRRSGLSPHSSPRIPSCTHTSQPRTPRTPSGFPGTAGTESRCRPRSCPRRGWVLALQDSPHPRCKRWRSASSGQRRCCRHRRPGSRRDRRDSWVPGRGRLFL